MDEEIFNKNLATLEGLASSAEFKKSIEKAREKISPSVVVRGIQSRHGESHDVLKDATDQILEEFNLPKSFYRVISDYIFSEEIEEENIPNYNYYISTTPDNFFLSDIGPVQRIWEIKLILYARLSKEEMEMAIKELKNYQDILFQKIESTGKDRDLLIEEMAEKLEPPVFEEFFEGYYLKEIKKRYDRGSITKEEFERIKKLHKEKIKKIRESGYTAKDISNDLKNIGIDVSESNIRTILSKKRREKRRINREDAMKLFIERFKK